MASITLYTQIDTSGAVADTQKLTAQIKTALKNGDVALARHTQSWLSASQSVEVYSARVEQLTAELAQLQTMQPTPTATPMYQQYEQDIQSIERYRATLDNLQARINAVTSGGGNAGGLQLIFDSLNGQLTQVQERADAARIALLNAQGVDVEARTEALTRRIIQQKEALQSVTNKANIAKTSLEQYSDTGSLVDNLSTKFANLGSMISRTLKRVAIYATLAVALRSLIKVVGNVMMSNEEFRNSLYRLQAALWTAFAPIIDYVVPALQLFIDILTAVISAVIQLIGWLTGKSYAEMVERGKEIHDQAAAYEELSKNSKKSAKGMKKVTDEAKKQTAAFDELMILQDKTKDKSGTGGAGGGLSGSIKDAWGQLTSDIGVGINEIFFKWDNLTAEDIGKKVIVGLNGLAGAIVGFGIGGVPAAIIGGLLGIALGLNISKAIFNDDGKLSAIEIADQIGYLLAGVIGAVIGFKYGGVTGAALGFTIGTSIMLGIKKMFWGEDGKFSAQKFEDFVSKHPNIFGGVLGALSGASLALAIGGTGVAAAAGTVGAILTIPLAIVFSLVSAGIIKKGDPKNPEGKGNVAGYLKWLLDKKKNKEIGEKVAQDIKDGLVEGLTVTPDGKIITNAYQKTLLDPANKTVGVSKVGEKSPVFANLAHGVLEGYNQGVEDKIPETKRTSGDLFSVIEETLETAWNNTVTWWNENVAKWWNEKVSPWFTKEKWETLYDTIKTTLKTKWDETVGQWAKDIQDWWDKHISPWFTWDKWKTLFDNMKQHFKDGFQKVKEWFTDESPFAEWLGTDGVIGKWFTWDKWKSLFVTLKDNFSTGFKAAANAAVSVLNSAIKKINSVLNFEWGDQYVAGHKVLSAGSIGLGKIKEITPPFPNIALAQGTVVPPNRPFAAWLGDNTREPEVVSPISTMKQAVQEAVLELGGSFGNGNTTVVLEVDGREFGRAVVEQGNRETRRIGTKLVVV